MPKSTDNEQSVRHPRRFVGVRFCHRREVEPKTSTDVDLDRDSEEQDEAPEEA